MFNNSAAPAGALFVLTLLPTVETVGYFRSSLRDLADRQVSPTESRRQFFAVGQMVAVPADQGIVAGVCKKKLQCRRFDVAVAKHHVGVALMTFIGCSGIEKSRV